jgi:hypothetical protein
VTAINFDYTWDLNSINLLPEDEVNYYIEGRDANDVTGPGIGRTEIYVARMPSVADLFAEFERKQEQQQDRLDEMVEGQEQARDVVDRIIEKLRKGHSLSVADRKEIEQAIRTQRDLDTKRQETSQDLLDLIEEAEKNDLFSNEMLHKIQEMQRLFREVASKDLQEAMRKLSEALDQLNRENQLRDLESAKISQEEFTKRLEQTIEQLKQLIVHQKIEKAAGLAREIDETQRKIVDSIEEMLSQNRNDGSNNLASQEKKLTGKMDELKNQIDQALQEMTARDVYEEIAPQLEDIGELVSSGEVQEHLSSAANLLQEKQVSRSLQPAGNAMKGTSGIRSKLDELLESLMGQDATELIAAVDAAVTEGLALISRQTNIIEKMAKAAKPGVGGEQTREVLSIATHQQLVSEGLQAIIDRLTQLSREQMGLGIEIIWELESVHDAMSRSIMAIEDGKPSLSLPIGRESEKGLRLVILHLLRSLDEMNQQMNAAGLQRMFEQLQQLAQEQARLNEMAQKMHDQMRQQGMTPGIERMLQQLALEQQMIREALERLAQKMDAFSQVLGDLQDVASSMKDVEDNLRQKRINQDLLDEQKRILTRMLESEKSLQRTEEESKERESQTAERLYDSSETDQIDSELLQIRKQLEEGIRSAHDAPIPEGYRELVRRYYELLSESQMAR